jgi:hypothetical protein
MLGELEEAGLIFMEVPVQIDGELNVNCGPRLSVMVDVVVLLQLLRSVPMTV